MLLMQPQMLQYMYSRLAVAVTLEKVGNMLFTKNTTNETNRWQHKPLITSSREKRVLKIRVMYTQN